LDRTFEKIHFQNDPEFVKSKPRDFQREDGDDSMLDFEELFNKVCANLNQLLKLNKRIDSKLSGSTGVMVLVNSKVIVTANVGDSRAAKLVKTKDGNLQAIPITNDHTPDYPGETERIIKAGGEIKPFKLANGKFVGPKRVWKKNKDTPGLMMTRSFGDEIGHSCGITSTPEVQEFNLEESIVGIVVASDGIWEKVPLNLIGAICTKHYADKNSAGAVNDLVNKAMNKWRTTSVVYMDDITCVVGFFDTEKLFGRKDVAKIPEFEAESRILPLEFE
jgi:serine/threonine protein phosphatase PrpC